MSLFICPVCKGNLDDDGKRLFCKNGHSFDKAAEGYTHLLLANKMNSKIPGDSKEMAASRSAFLNKGYYAPLLEKLGGIIENLSGVNEISLLDCGCGEGYYTSGIYERLSGAGISPKVAGFDISRPSVKRAAKRNKNIEFAVASVFDIPVLCSKFDILLNVFSPLAVSEYHRVLKDGGYYIYVVPAAKHLWELKAAIYDKPYENSESDIEYKGFEHVKTERVRYEFTLDNKEDIASLFQMTPYYWKTSAKGAEKLKSLEKLTTKAAFDIHIYKKYNSEGC